MDKLALLLILLLSLVGLYSMAGIVYGLRLARRVPFSKEPHDWLVAVTFVAAAWPILLYYDRLERATNKGNSHGE